MYEEWLEKNGQDPNKLYSRDELYCLNENLLMEMANISREDTKLPYEIWIDSSGVKRGNEHTFSPRIKIQVPGIKEWIPITISDDPEIPDSVKKKNNIKIPKFNTVREWVIAYKKILLAHFFKEINDKQALSLLTTTDKAHDAEIKLGEYIGKKPNSKIEWFYNTTDGIFEAQVKDNNDIVVLSSVATNKYDMWVEIQELKKAYDIDDENIVFTGEK